jgi:hypothetical protein
MAEASEEFPMAKTTDRRHFLMSSGLVALAVAGEGALGNASAQAPPAHASLQTRMPRLFTGLCAFSFGPLFKSGEMTFESFFERAIELKADAVDMTGYYLKSAEPTYLNHLRNPVARPCYRRAKTAARRQSLNSRSGSISPNSLPLLT